MIYYRKDLFKQAGIDPASIKTWDQLRDAAKKLTVVKDGRTETWGLGVPLAPIKTESTPMLIGMLDGPQPVFNGCKANYATDAGVKALTYTASLIDDAKVTPKEALVNNVDDVTDQFVAGRYAMAISSNLRFSVIAKNAKFGGDNVGILRMAIVERREARPHAGVGLVGRRMGQVSALGRGSEVRRLHGEPGGREALVHGGRPGAVAQVAARRRVLPEARERLGEDHDRRMERIELDGARGVQHAHAAVRPQRGARPRDAGQDRAEGGAGRGGEEVRRGAVDRGSGARP